LPGAAIIADPVAHTISNPVELDGTVNFFGTSNLTFTGAATLTGGRALQVLDAPQTVTFSGGIGEGVFGSQSLTKGGLGTLVLSGANTYTGTTNINNDAGTLGFKDGGTPRNNPSTITVGQGATLRLDNTGTQNLTDRLTDQAPINLNNATLSFLGAAGAASSETLGVVTLGSNLASNIQSSAGAAGT